MVSNESAFAPTVDWSGELRTLAMRFGTACAIVDQYGNQLTYRALNTRAHDFAQNLLVRGIQHGEPIGTLLPNGLDTVVASFGIRLAGAAEVPMSWGYTDGEIEWCARLSGFKHVFTLGSRTETLATLGLTPHVVSCDDSSLPPVPLKAIRANAPSRILFTSGTTGRPKGVVYQHGPRWVGEQLLKASLPFTPQAGDRIVLMTPFPHGSSLMTYAWTAFGGEVVLLDGVDPEAVLQWLEPGKVDAIFAPPTVLAKLTDAFGKRQFGGVRCIFTGTQPLATGLYRRVCTMFGPVVRITYGKTECVNPITWLEPSEVHRWFDVGNSDNDDVATPAQGPSGACVGWPAPGVQIQIAPLQADSVPGEGVDHADDGEILLRAVHMSSGLISEAGFIPHEPDGWHPTGDLGHFDCRGRLILTGRIADVIKTGGYRVNPDEIESQLADLANTGQICITSVPSEYWGEIIVAVAEQAHEGWIDEVRERVAMLSRHKRPRLYLATHDLPRNPQGKINRRQVSRHVLELCVLEDGPYPALHPNS